MLKVRGESMTDAGILDGDFVVVRSQPDAESGDIVVAAIGEDEATVKTLRKRRGKILLVPTNPAYSEIEIAARPCRDLRQGRDRTPAPLSRTGAPSTGCEARKGPEAQRPLGFTRSKSAVPDPCDSFQVVAADPLPAVWASSGSPGPKFTAGMPRALKKATSDQPSFARGALLLAETNAARRG